MLGPGHRGAVRGRRDGRLHHQSHHQPTGPGQDQGTGNTVTHLTPHAYHLSSAQVHRLTIPDTIRSLWVSERMKIFQKGLTARMTSSSIYSLAVIFGYESVKKLSVLPQYKQVVAW